MGLQDSKKDFFFSLQQIRRLAGVLSFSLLLYLLHFQETPEKNLHKACFPL